jgi:hypothetical protein
MHRFLRPGTVSFTIVGKPGISPYQRPVVRCVKESTASAGRLLRPEGACSRYGRHLKPIDRSGGRGDYR